jgi:hypothetical protein
MKNNNYENVILLGDKGYNGVENIISPKRNSPFYILTDEEKELNKKISKKRACIERVFSAIKLFQCLGGVFRGSKEKITSFLNIIVDIYNYNQIQKLALKM